MATVSNLNVGIGTELGGLRSGLSKAQKMMTSFSEGVESRLGSISTAKMEKGLSNIGAKAVPAANKLQSSLGRVNRSTRGSTAAVVNFNRVIQDAPFGIIGVANNLEPLISSFGQLKQQTGSTTGALKSLLTSAFTGPGALITAVSVASSLLIVFGDRLFGAKKEAEELTDSMSNLNESWEKAIELQEKFGAFDEDEVGIDKLNAQIREVSEQIEEQQNRLREVNMLESRRDEIQQQIAASSGMITASLEKELQKLETQIGQYQDSEQLQLSINKLQDKRQDLSEELVALGEALADSDTRQARENQKSASATERQLAAQREISALQMGGFVDVPAAETERMADAFMNMPDSPFKQTNEGLEVMRGSIADLEMRVQAFRNMRRVIDPNSEAFQQLTNSIEGTEKELADLLGETESIQKEGVQNIASLTTGFGRLAGAIIKGKKEALSFSNIMSAVLPGLLNVLFPGGGGVGGFLSGIVGGVFHDGGVVPGPMGKEQLALVQGGETIRTPAQERSLGSSVKVHVTGEFRQRGSDLVATINKTETGTLR